MRYAGLSPGAKAHKYRGCKRVDGVRKLTRTEIVEFRRYVGWILGDAVLPEPRKRRAAV